MPRSSTSNRRRPLEEYVAHGEAAGLRWTAQRQAVLRLIWSAERPIGAYEVAGSLGTRGSAVHPASIYRCLRCLEEAGLILPVLLRKRHVLSPDPAIPFWGFLLCRSCGSCTPVPLAGECAALDLELRRRGFRPRAFAAEAQGRCRACAEEARLQ